MAVFIDNLSNCSSPSYMRPNYTIDTKSRKSQLYRRDNEIINEQQQQQNVSLPSKRLKMKRSFSINSIKSSNSLNNHPLNDDIENDTPQKDNDDDTEIDDYESDELSCSSCSSSHSNMFDYGRNSYISIPSSINNSLSLSFSVSSSPPSVYSPPSITTTSFSPISTMSVPRSLKKSCSTDSLSLLLQKSSPPTKKSMYSNLTTSLKSIKNRVASYNKENIIKFVMDSPEFTDDRLPPIIKEEIHIEEMEDSDDMQELTTFKASNNQFPDHHQHDYVKYKTRESRCNAQFLKLYAYDRSARTNTMTLPNSTTQEELKRIMKSRPQIKKFHYAHNVQRISNMSREKLWSSVVLPPRNDESPGLSINGDNYILVDSEVNSYSIVRKEGKYLPWLSKESIKPAGVLSQGKWLFNSEAPNSGVTKSQFTVKGWCNPRWIEWSDSDE